MEKQTEKLVAALNTLSTSDKKDELKQIEGVFVENLMKYLICANLKEPVNLQDIIKTYELNDKSKRRKVYNFSEFPYLLFI